MKEKSCCEILNEEIEGLKVKYPALSRQEECQLGLLFQKGDKKALETLLLSNAGFWRMKALSCKNPQVETEDMFQEIVVKVLEKAEKYNGSKAKFSTYMNAWCNLVLSESISKLSQRDKDYFNQILKAKEILFQQNNREATEREVAEFLGWSEKKYIKIKKILSSGAAPVSVDNQVYNEDGESCSFLDLCSQDYYNPESQYEMKELKSAINEGLGKLSWEEKIVIESLYDFETGEKTSMTTRKLAQRMNVSHQTVANIRDRALLHLRKSFDMAGFAA